ncbi:DUF5131 family protein [Neoaquamicrobium sediminum]|uniref:DUF5131 family protein n=1 Tax=Neoaquamicrobium sediminum TaxID=1849104 RepID=A0ABV3WYS5_9HYPH
MASEPAIWNCKDVLEPFRWLSPRVVQVQRDLFEPEIREAWRDKVFAAMALCPQHRFVLSTAYPSIYRHYVQTIASDRSEYVTWRVSASFILDDLGLGYLATGEGPKWPLVNVELID